MYEGRSQSMSVISIREVLYDDDGDVTSYGDRGPEARVYIARTYVHFYRLNTDWKFIIQYIQMDDNWRSPVGYVLTHTASLDISLRCNTLLPVMMPETPVT